MSQWIVALAATEALRQAQRSSEQRRRQERERFQRRLEVSRRRVDRQSVDLPEATEEESGPRLRVSSPSETTLWLSLA